MITRADILMGRDTEYPTTPEMEANLLVLVPAINKFVGLLGRDIHINSGYRPGHYNTDAGGAANSPHLTCQAVDIADADRSITNWIMANTGILVDCGIYMEAPIDTPSWLHVQVRPVASGHRIFNK